MWDQLLHLFMIGFDWIFQSNLCLKHSRMPSLNTNSDVSSISGDSVMNPREHQRGSRDECVGEGVRLNTGGCTDETDGSYLHCTFPLIYRSIFHLTQLCVPHLIKTKGSIVNVSSVNGQRSVGINAASSSMYTELYLL